MPVLLGIGNHETIPPKTRAEYLAQFSDWLNAPRMGARFLEVLDGGDDFFGLVGKP